MKEAVLSVFAVAGVITALVVIGTTLELCGEASQVAREEFGPREALRKYEWFKDAAAQLEKKQADIGVFEGRLRSLEDTYKDLPRQKWPREDREQYNIWSSEVAGVKSSYNTLAAEYNAQMAKVNWRFAEVGNLPAGADKPLPREFKSYETK